MALNQKQENFCLEYVKTSNAAASYKKAYSITSETAAYSASSRLLRNAAIRERLVELSKEMRSEKIATATEIQERLSKILRMEETEDVVVTEGVGDGCSEAKIIAKRPQLKDVIKAGETLAKMQGTLDNTVNVSVNVPVFGGDESLVD